MERVHKEEMAEAEAMGVTREALGVTRERGFSRMGTSGRRVAEERVEREEVVEVVDFKDLNTHPGGVMVDSSPEHQH